MQVDKGLAKRLDLWVGGAGKPNLEAFAPQTQVTEPSKPSGGGAHQRGGSHGGHEQAGLTDRGGDVKPAVLVPDGSGESTERNWCEVPAGNGGECG